jgi:isoquinoline 1-oxidoreductase beta subunit
MSAADPTDTTRDLGTGDEAPAAVSRRDFLRSGSLAGTGLLIGFIIPRGAERGWRRAAATRASVAASADPFEPNAWLRIDGEGAVTVMLKHSEMGQGVATSLPMLVAEELDADWSKVRFEFAPADAKKYGEMMTGGSASVAGSWKPLRTAGATARAMLVTAAASRLGVDPSSLRTESGAVIHDASARRIAYGELVADASTLTPPADVPLKDPSAFRLIGRRTKRLDTPLKVDGSATFGIDVKVPGMLVASVVRCGVCEGTVKSFDATAARKVKGVRDVVQIADDAIAVLADGMWPALKGRRALVVHWNEGPLATLDSAQLERTFAKEVKEPGVVAREVGDVSKAGGTRHEATYSLPYLAHAPMEPMNCTAHVHDGGVDVWVPTQYQTGAREAAAKLAGVPLERVQIHTTFLGGGFGRRAENDFLADAVLASKAAKAPVKVIWTREDDIQHDWYRPASRHAIAATVDASGMPVAWTHHIVAPSVMKRWFPDAVAKGLDPDAVGGAAEELPLSAPNIRVTYQMSAAPVPVGWWRSVGYSQNGFVVESFVDELAHAAKRDPVEYRRALYASSPRHLAVRDAAAKAAGWGTPLPAGRARGVAVFLAFGTYAAEVAEVSLDRAGAPRVHRVVCAVDCGMVVNPDTVEAQVESAIAYGLTAALDGEITLAGGKVQQSNFHDYRVLRHNRMPKVDVIIVPSTQPPSGIGEPGTPPIAPAVANALFALTGKRARRLPLSEAMKNG